MHRYAQGMETERITFSIPSDLAKAAEKKASEDRRSLSGYIAKLVETDVRQSGHLGNEVNAELQAAVEQVGPERALEALRAEARRKRRRVTV